MCTPDCWNNKRPPLSSNNDTTILSLDHKKERPFPALGMVPSAKSKQNFVKHVKRNEEKPRVQSFAVPSNLAIGQIIPHLLDAVLFPAA